MKTLYEGILGDIKEGLLSDMETTIEKGTQEAKDLFERNFIKQNLFTDSWENRKKAINLLKEMVLRYNPTHVKTTAKIKNSNSIFVEFYDTTTGADKTPVTGVTYGRRIGSNWWVYDIPACDGSRYYFRPTRYIDSWNRIQPNLDPKIHETYFVPDELITLFNELLDPTNSPRL